MTVSGKKHSLLDLIKNNNLSDTVTDTDLFFVIQGSADRRHSLVKRSLKQGDLIQIRRGLYLLNERYRSKKVNSFELAQRIYGPSYISLETALSYWGLIPEAVYTVANACSRKSAEFRTPLGDFSYTRIPFHPLYTQVLCKNENHSVFFIASPFRALLDYVYASKKQWKLDALTESLRIEEIPRVEFEEFMGMKIFYTNWRVQLILNEYQKKMYS